MYRHFFVVFTVVVLIHGGSSSLNPFEAYAIKFREYAAKILPATISHDLMGNPFNTINKIINDPNVKSCTKHLLDYVKHPDSPKIPDCVHQEDLEALGSALKATWRLPSGISSNCVNVFWGNPEVLKKCRSQTSDKAIEIQNTVGKAFRNINASCGQYIRDNKDKIIKYYKGGCKGDFKKQS